jgi:hypothetical protein
MVEKPLQLLSSFNAFSHRIDIQVLASAMIVRTIAASLGSEKCRQQRICRSSAHQVAVASDN